MYWLQEQYKDNQITQQFLLVVNSNFVSKKCSFRQFLSYTRVQTDQQLSSSFPHFSIAWFDPYRMSDSLEIECLI
jgi:hypothetical protein